MPWTEAIPFVDLWMATRNGLLHLSRWADDRGWLVASEFHCYENHDFDRFSQLPGTKIFFLVIWLEWFSMYPGGWNGSTLHDGGPHPASAMSSARCHFFGLDVCVKCSTAGCSDCVAVAHRAIGKVANASAGGVWQLSAWFRYGVILCNYEANEVLNQRAWCFFHVFQQFQTVLQLKKPCGHVPPRRALSNNNILCCFSFWYLVVQNSDAAWGSELLTALMRRDIERIRRSSWVQEVEMNGANFCHFGRDEWGFCMMKVAWGVHEPLGGLALDALACQGLQILAAETRWEHPATEIDSANLHKSTINIRQYLSIIYRCNATHMIYCGLLWFTMIY